MQLEEVTHLGRRTNVYMYMYTLLYFFRKKFCVPAIFVVLVGIFLQYFIFILKTLFDGPYLKFNLPKKHSQLEQNKIAEEKPHKFLLPLFYSPERLNAASFQNNIPKTSPTLPLHCPLQIKS